MCGLQLGFLSTYLSEPIVKAFTSAAAFHVTVSQLQSMLDYGFPDMLVPSLFLRSEIVEHRLFFLVTSGIIS